MTVNPKLALVLCLALVGCLDPEGEPGADTEELDTGETEQALASDHHYSRTYGGSIFSSPFTYVTEDGLPSGACSPGFVRPPAPIVQWTSASGGHCQFGGWVSSDPHDCRALINGSTGGGWFGGTCDTWVHEVPESVPGGAFSYTAFNTNSAQVNTTNYWISLTAGQTVTLGTCGVAGASFSGDTYLRLYNASNVQVAANDDSCGGLGSRLVYTASSGGSFQIRAGCYSNSSCSATAAWTLP
jgi:hypothetical protein